MNITLEGRRALVTGVDSGIGQAIWADPAMSADLLTKIPLGRMGTTGEIADDPEFARGG